MEFLSAFPFSLLFPANSWWLWWGLLEIIGLVIRRLGVSVLSCNRTKSFISPGDIWGLLFGDSRERWCLRGEKWDELGDPLVNDLRGLVAIVVLIIRKAKTEVGQDV